MKTEQQGWTVGLNKVWKGIEKYKFVLLVMIVGVVLLCLPDFSQTTSGQTTGVSAEELVQTTDISFDLEATEEKLASMLSQISGVGEVQVMLTVKSGTQQILAQDSSLSTGENSREESQSTVIISAGSGLEETVTLQQIYPQYQGALVVCQGADSSKVRLAVLEAVSALTGLSSDKISICQGVGT